VDRLACIDAPAFPLQLLLREHPEFRDQPAAVVAEDRPQAPLVWVNEKARIAGVLPGQRYATALSLASGLRAGTVSVDEIDRGVALVTRLLRRFTPEIEASKRPGVFWLNARGLGRLYPSLEVWVKEIEAELERAGFEARLVVGFKRFATYAVAKSIEGRKIFEDPQEEQAAALHVRLDRLEIEPRVRDELEKLGIRTVGEFLRLPAKGLLQRFGPEAYRVHRFASGELWTPLQNQPELELPRRAAELPGPDTDVERLVFLSKRLLDSLLSELAARGEALAEIVLRLAIDHAGEREERIRPAAPTLDSLQILNLIRLRLESLRLQAGVVELGLTALFVPATREQLLLFAEKPPRDLEAAGRAFARLRAEFGERVVARARLSEGHLPAARYHWDTLEKAGLPRPREGKVRVLVRRIFEKPIPLPPRPRHEPDGWLLRGLEHGPVSSFVGPYIFSGGWWRGEVHREYYFVRMQRGEILWVYYDRRRRQWFLEGRVE
jgi:protein ImuB